jgi:hypothetical protein
VIEYHEQALVIHREIGDRRGEWLVLDKLGIANRLLGNLPQSIELHRQSQEIAKELADISLETKAGWDLGLALEQSGELQQATAAMQPRVDYLREIGHAEAEKHAEQLAALKAKLAGGGGNGF